jgi:tetratricopeptide (TPR) repeat protein
MHRLVKFGILICISLGFAGLLSGCQLFSAKSNSSELSDPLPAPLQEAVQQLELGKWVRAQNLLEQFIVGNPTTRWQLLAQLKLGVAFENQDQFSQALKQYRGVAEGSERWPELQAEAQFRKSFCYEALGDEVEVVAALNDAWRLRYNLSPHQRDAELPARLAAAYARAGNLAEAEKYFRLADAGFVKAQASLEGERSAWMARTLYTMGHITTRAVTWDDFSSQIRAVPRAQIYLVRASFTKVAPYADMALKEIYDLYQRFVKVLDLELAVPRGDSVEQVRDLQRTQWSRVSEVFELIRQARSFLATQSSKVPEFELLLDKTELRLQKILVTRPPSEGLTQESRDRKSQVRGATIDPVAMPNSALKAGSSLQPKAAPVSKDEEKK